MNYDREHKVHLLLSLADLLERDSEMRAALLDIDATDEWLVSKARLARDLAASIGDGDAVS